MENNTILERQTVCWLVNEHPVLWGYRICTGMFNGPVTCICTKPDESSQTLTILRI